MNACSVITSLVLATSALLAMTSSAQSVKLDVSQVPEQKEWGLKAAKIMEEWHPRISQFLASPGFTPPGKCSLLIDKNYKGVAFTTGTKITVSSEWIAKHPEDLGVAVHELVHVVQQYPPGQPVWVTEGIADYIRWVQYEKKKLKELPVANEDKGYTKGYQVTAGFFLWLEKNGGEGIVRKLNAAMRKKQYSDQIFEDVTGTNLDDLWSQYLAVREKGK
ncbi:Peptidase [Rubritalea squalenifaciens DSM 18772]|uniref:Peptidase n=1 Tax=Rubritalea squalenifaciens DSM 18772 TaxID=1123071 RepID=A0A1M6AWE1_9BACT|nr:basic secretory protein-like protein [Rubritalea squalenifaciens]SHI40814.1 Peptidase [Rubritalea squalenifaciens DSM 18772]